MQKLAHCLLEACHILWKFRASVLHKCGLAGADCA